MTSISFNPYSNYQSSSVSQQNPPKPPSAEEVAQKIMEESGTTQTDSSGETTKTITKEEFVNALSRLPRPPQQSFDAEEIFEAADADENGVLDETELTSAMEQQMQAMHQAGNEQRPPAPPDPSKYVTTEGVTKEQLIQNIISDMEENAPSDQQFDETEATKMATEIANRLFEGDADEDGKLTTDEVESMKPEGQPQIRAWS